MKIEIFPSKIKFSGVLDENTSGDLLQSAYEAVSKADPGKFISVDFSDVARANSSGILVWLRFLLKVNHPFKYINVPVWMVSQFNIINGYFTGNCQVESIQAPFFSPHTQQNKNILLHLGKDLPLQKCYQEFSIANQMIEGHEFEMDFDPRQYFHFITLNYDKFSFYVR